MDDQSYTYSKIIKAIIRGEASMPLYSILFLDDKPLYSILCAQFPPSSSIVYYIYLFFIFLGNIISISCLFFFGQKKNRRVNKLKTHCLVLHKKCRKIFIKWYNHLQIKLKYDQLNNIEEDSQGSKNSSNKKNDGSKN